MKFVLASKNKHKAEEIKEILGGKHEIITMDDAGIGDLEIIEDGDTFEENALKKAHAVYDTVNLPTIADDSGLCVDALSGKPGIYTARFAGKNATDSENIAKLLDELKDFDMPERSAHFVCVIALIENNMKEPKLFRGECSGYIAKQTSGTSGFGYDPIFFYPEYKSTLAELPAEKKNRISHRYNALKQFSEYISEN